MPIWGPCADTLRSTVPGRASRNRLVFREIGAVGVPATGRLPRMDLDQLPRWNNFTSSVRAGVDLCPIIRGH